MAENKILIVDEDIDHAKELEGRLRALGYEVAAIAASEADAITAMKVHELEDRFFAVSIDMLCSLDFSGFFKRLNPAWEKTLGYTRKELMSRPFIEFVHPDDRERTLKQNAAVRSGGQALSFENRYLCKDGTFKWLRWNAAPDFSEKVIYSMARDITASKQAENEREQLVRELQAALAEVKTLRAILPICSYCRRIRDEENHWHTVEEYVAEHTTSQFSHGICPTCMAAEVASLEREAGRK
jgi:PAS domain S-box-containing protein